MKLRVRAALREQLITDREELLKLTQTIWKQDEEVAALRAQLETQEKEIVKLKAMNYVLKDSQLCTYDGLSERAAQANALEEKNAKLKSEIISLETQLNNANEIHHSE